MKMSLYTPEDQSHMLEALKKILGLVNPNELAV
jgi:hypothetical protein